MTARVPLLTGLSLCAGCAIDHLLSGSPLFVVALGVAACLCGKETLQGKGEVT